MPIFDIANKEQEAALLVRSGKVGVRENRVPPSKTAGRPAKKPVGQARQTARRVNSDY
jgi:hypothetical protein